MIELLAPAGSLEILKAAVDSGADAVYCGMSAFNARINASNLTEEEFREGAEYCHYRGSRIYLTLNTLVSDSEFNDAVETAIKAYESGVDGILIQDVGLLSYLHDNYPEIPLHCSTQMNIFSDEDYRRLSELGVRRIVLPRELSLEEIRRRSKAASRYKMETEVFAHGAVCVCYSGLCLFSAMNRSGSRSGNRGLCAQPCREEYTLINNGKTVKSGHLLSPKDRDVTSYIGELISSGTASLKLEGRMRDRNYVMAAVTSYRRLIDAYYNGELDQTLVDDVRNDLLVNFNRGGSYTTQFLTGKKEGNMLSGEYPGKYGLKIGRICALNSRKGTVTFSYTLRQGRMIIPDKGDYLSIRDRDREVCSFPVGKVHEMPEQLAVKGLHPDMIDKLKPGYDVFLMGHKTAVDPDALRKTDITLSVEITDKKITLNAMAAGGINNNIFAEYSADIPSGYEGRPLEASRIRDQLSRFGDTPFRAANIYFTGAEEINCPVSLINDARRKIVQLLCDEIGRSYERHVVIHEDRPGEDDTVSGTGSITRMLTYPSVADNLGILTPGADIYVFSIYDLNIKAVREHIASFAEQNNARICMMLPDLYHDRTSDMLLSAASALKELAGDRFLYYMDSRVHGSNKELDKLGLEHLISGGANIYNRRSLLYASGTCKGMYLSYELSDADIISIAGKGANGAGIILHEDGPVRWMQTDFCPVGGNKVKCGQCFDGGIIEMTGKSMDDKVRVIPRRYDCSSEIYGEAKNKIPEYVADELIENGLNVIVNRTIL